ncbi:hypothetical protein [Streptomyces sp. NBC_00091]|uniref:hypothetical protein n=1 Tax=Streptomyces sp. NBC_00091 TaxID=2975648 RepID=UPI00224D7C2F|nr:hypothetical protein [Streptomyces sp. NBC_00091]MCX5378129.1 hypothetical protein [Streptomyces sp. NBC_00091]
MNLKRMAVVAAAAVVGPTVLMATPAMADEAQNPAVTTPDTAPKDDAAAPAPEAPAAAKPAAETPAVTPAVETPAVTPAAPAPAPAAPAPAKPTAEKPAPAPAPAPADEEYLEDQVATGPVLGLGGVPSAFKAGGDWTNLTVTVDNSKGKAQESYVLVLAVGDKAAELEAEDVKIQIFHKGAWHDAEVMSHAGSVVALLTDDIAIPAEKLSLKVRVKFNAGAPAGEIIVAAAGGSNVDENVFSDTAIVKSEIVSRSTNGGGNTGGNTGTKPNGGGTTTPIVDNGGSGNTGNNGGNTNTGGQLAETGADAATSWALGAGGVALAMGAALVAGTGRRRRVSA